MKLLITGATGFIARHLIPQLLSKGHIITATARSDKSIKALDWYSSIDFISHDINTNAEEFNRKCGPFDCMIHLAWGSLQNYKDLAHIETILPAQFAFIKSIIQNGTKRIVITGTCLEYGMIEGCLHEETQTHPETPYGLAKDTLRRFLEELQKHVDFSMRWIRLFYIHGKGQSPNSLPAQLDCAVNENRDIFNMSAGEQLRDYLAINEVTQIIEALSTNNKATGIYNCCSEKPIKIKDFAQKRLESRGSTMKLNLGYYKYPDYEPMAFWGSRKKTDDVLRHKN